jgi:hypothetical protein
MRFDMRAVESHSFRRFSRFGGKTLSAEDAVWCWRESRLTPWSLLPPGEQDAYQKRRIVHIAASARRSPRPDRRRRED